MFELDLTIFNLKVYFVLYSIFSKFCFDLFSLIQRGPGPQKRKKRTELLKIILTLSFINFEDIN